VCIKAFRSLTVRARVAGVYDAAARRAIDFAVVVPLSSQAARTARSAALRSAGGVDQKKSAYERWKHAEGGAEYSLH